MGLFDGEKEKQDVKIESAEENLNPKPKLDVSALEYNEIFSYLGDLYVMKRTRELDLDVDGKIQYKRFVERGVAWEDNARYKDGAPVIKRVKRKVDDSQAVLEEFGHPLTESIEEFDEITPEELFVVDRPIKYERRGPEGLGKKDWGKITLRIEGNKLVKYDEN